VATRRLLPTLLVATATATLTAAAAAQTAGGLTLSQAVDRALQDYPAIRVSQEQLNAAAAGIRLARTAYLPRIDTIALVNRATRNNVFGLLLPQSVIPSMSGPVIGSNNTGTAWGSALGGLVTWEPFDFGLRQAGVAVAQAGKTQQEAALQRTRYEVAVATADAFLTLAAAEETVRAAQAGVDRTATVLQTVRALVGAELRPGADSARAEGEAAAARTQLAQAHQAAAVARANLSRFVALDPSQVSIAMARRREPPAKPAPPAPDMAANPLVVEQNAVVEQTRAQLHALERSYFPRFSLQGALYARGTGAETNGAVLGGVNGLAPTVQNFAVGFTVTFPVMDKPALQAREAVEAANMRAQTARAQQIVTDLRAQWNTAVANLEGARQVAAGVPAEAAAARAAASQAEARYRSGLGNIDAVAEAQRLVTQSEIDDSLARLGVWRGLLGLAAAAGDIQPFLAEVGQ
jgi:outer membrane protein